ncbi:hypothetical protein [Persicitalea jodogahamensis]|uniref:Uncharacterized protein n=1 Tax=Persicitalea jodogahamensis TaxID=402147 RepID=A0A8J3DAJ6_9BACT|nr:hypothetical protein [Persicitalea jodogahamensis]GHB82822.1 hypothetical protein GCM10007390_42120 [Persicitalea jodogahamensis]
MTHRELFFALYQSSTESEVESLLKKHPTIFEDANWYPLGGNPSNYGVIENQQSSSIAALIEKLTNSIDAILTRQCYEAGIDPKSAKAPRSMEEAVSQFFPNSRDWDLPGFRKKQAENLQILADGPKLGTSLIIYDNGEGQHPQDFENTFLSLLRGNKNEIHFVQGKYNMGGSGSIVFCGKKRYQLIGSRKFDKSGAFGFTLVRSHPLSDEEKTTKKNTWYEYLKLDGHIPYFEIDQLDLGLYNRKFETGTVIKLYSYDLPAGSRSVISRDLNQSLNEYLFEPALPILTVDTKERYPKDINLERPLYGLKRRLEQDENKYIEDYFSETYVDELFGKNGQVKVTCYVFKNKVDEKSVTETKNTINSEFFKNNMAVLFSVNGQVHGHYTSEFITRSLKMNLLKNHLLIHVDCTNVDIDFRNELFMASRDRLKDGNETRDLRSYLAKKLGAKDGRLAEIEKKRKEGITVEQSDSKELIKSFTKNLPLNSDLMKLLNKTFKLDSKPEEPKKGESPKAKPKSEQKIKEPFKPERFPSVFKVKIADKNGIRAVNIPRGTEKIIRFDTDVENNYFDRIDEPGSIKISLLSVKGNETEGGSEKGEKLEVSEFFNVHTSSPQEGTIRIGLNPKADVRVGEDMELKVTLTGAGEEFEEIFWAKITDPETPKQEAPKPEPEEEQMGLPEMVLVYKEPRDETTFTWAKFSENAPEEMNHNKVMYPMASGDLLESIYINMDSSVLKSYLSKYKTTEQIEVANRKYYTSVFFHVLFLYTISRNRKYEFSLPTDEKRQQGQETELSAYLMDIFDNHYTSFILNFGMNDIMEGLG